MTGPATPSSPAPPNGGPYRQQAVANWDLAVLSDDQFRLLRARAWWWLAGAILLGGALLVWAALTPSSAAFPATARIDASDGRTAVVVVSERQAAAITPDLPVSVGDLPQVSGRITAFGPPLSASAVARQTGLVPRDAGRQVVLTVRLDEPLPLDSRQQAAVTTSERSVLDRVLGRR